MKYQIDFYYTTDQRVSKTVEASNEVRALGRALDLLSIYTNSWVDKTGFWLKISAAKQGTVCDVVENEEIIKK